MNEMDYSDVFREEASELLEELETSLLELEKTPADQKLVARVFRALHTIKGSGAMFGFDDISRFTHQVETVLDQVRNRSVTVSKKLINGILSARDHINHLLETSLTGGQEDKAAGEAIIDILEKIVRDEVDFGDSSPRGSAWTDDRSDGPLDADVQDKAEEMVIPAALIESEEQYDLRSKTGIPESTLDSPKKDQTSHYCIYFQAGDDFRRQGGDVDVMLRELASLGELTVFAQSREKDRELFRDILLTTNKGLGAIKNVLAVVEKISRTTVVPLQSEEDGDLPEHRLLGEILVDRGEISREQLREILSQQKPVGLLLTEAKLVSESKIESALAEQRAIKQKRAKRAGLQGESIRVGSEKLDSLINLVGELVVTQARLSQIAGDTRTGDLVEPVEELERLTAELRDNILNIRMVPIGSTFSRFHRLVRDLAAELGKEIELITEGAETELDKSVIDQLSDPLIHLIRNCIDHGIETPQERKAAGKPSKGCIKLSAGHYGAHVIITIADDGRGLDPDAISSKAEEKGLLSRGDWLPESEVFKLVFEPGFSTSPQVTSLSGRGVGMDVVKTAIEGSLKGSVSISSMQGKGTDVVITLPLTLAIIDGLLVRVGATYFVLPLPHVEECLEFTGRDIDKFHGRRVYSLRDMLVPYVILRDFFQIDGRGSGNQQIVIVNINGKRFGLVLDHVIGSHQTVIKSLGWAYRNAEGLSGATILGNGEVALIIDVATLLKMAESEEELHSRQYVAG